ncbi:MAG: TlpA family protein disulfide reductase [Candidatus Thorarchaeota archaeon]
MPSQDRRLFIILAVIFSVFAGYMIWDQINKSVSGGVDVGHKATDFTVPGVNGSSFTLSDYLGKVVIIDFLATTCVPCQNQLDELDLVAPLYDDVVIVSIEIDSSLSWSDFVNYANYKNVTWFMGHDSSIGQKYKVSYIPTIIIVDKEGTIIFRELYTSHSKLKEQLEQILPVETS